MEAWSRSHWTTREVPRWGTQLRESHRLLRVGSKRERSLPKAPTASRAGQQSDPALLSASSESSAEKPLSEQDPQLQQHSWRARSQSSFSAPSLTPQLHTPQRDHFFQHNTSVPTLEPWLVPLQEKPLLLAHLPALPRGSTSPPLPPKTPQILLQWGCAAAHPGSHHTPFPWNLPSSAEAAGSVTPVL